MGLADDWVMRIHSLGLARIGLAAAVGLAVGVAGCSKGSPNAPDATRTYSMGFTPISARPDFPSLLAGLQMWTPRADAGLLSNELPWDSLLAGVPPETLVVRDLKPMADYYRGLGFAFYLNIDPTNGLNRSADADPLVAAGRSLTEAPIRDLYRAYVMAANTIVNPDYLGLASETNLVRAAAPAPLYDAMVQAANDAAADVRAVDAGVQLFTTAQVEMAWGRLLPPGTYLGIAQDRADFPFIQALGLSSYPYLGGFVDPDSIPDDYYTRLVQGSPVPQFVIEGGWSSVAVLSPSSPAMQARYIRRHAELLDEAQAIAWFQLTFSDLDLSQWPIGITPFAHLGLVDENLVAKPALAEWDAVFARRRR